jgi:hypothetical protein
LDRKLQGIPSSMRQALIENLAHDKPLPPQLKGLADDIRAAQKSYLTDLQKIAEVTKGPKADSLGNTVQFLNMKDRYKLADAMLDAAGPRAGANKIPGYIGQALQQMGNRVETPEQLDQLIMAAAADRMSPGQLVDAMRTGQGPLAAMGPMLQPKALEALGSKLAPDVTDKGEYNARMQFLMSTTSAMASLPGVTTRDPNLLGANEINALLQRGNDPQALADAAIGGQLKGKMTKEGYDALQGAMLAQMQQLQARGVKLPADQVDAMQRRMDTLHQMSEQMPATANVLTPQAQAMLAQADRTGQVLRAVTGGPAVNDPVAQVAQRQMGAAQNPLPFVDPRTTAGAGMSMDPMGTLMRGQAATGAAATLGMGMIPTGDTAFDIANSVAHSNMFSPAEQALLNQIQDPQQKAMQALQMFMQKQALIATTLSNLANMRHEMMKTVANNLRA